MAQMKSKEKEMKEEREEARQVCLFPAESLRTLADPLTAKDSEHSREEREERRKGAIR
jgi:hypothetical protein